ncbi:hypothetical protein TCAL_07076 [Tigriopus californicus]|uniref:HDAg domain-containing protein n=1 Tax=Tigriopus californicus TaxID=6832 RepID=A0A553PNU7_TIGCA|nr:negative elongation factor A-like [Tigriopus californicus]TRY79357.1 hypothetical protein TCAL_07076 [Tigriopus californicus]
MASSSTLHLTTHGGSHTAHHAHGGPGHALLGGGGPPGAAGGGPQNQSDIAFWLHNKLGTSNDSWTGGSIVSQLNPELLVKIEHCFCDLQPQVKLKLLLSLFHIQKRNLEANWKTQLDAILQVAQEDSEPWVAMLAELLKTYPATGQLNADIRVPDTNRKLFTDLLADMKKVLKKSDQSDTVLPMECHFLNKNAFISLVGHQPQTIKHFALKRKPKAAALKAELLNKSQEAANKVKSSSSGSFPIRKSTMPRKMSDTGGALKALPSRTFGGGFKSQRPAVPPRSNRKPEGGVKLLDITEQPIGFAAAKKRKRQQELEEIQAKKAQAKEEKEAAAKAAAAAKTTPDYAAGLSTMNPPTPAPAPSGVSSTAPPPPAYAPPTPLQSTVSTPSYAPQPPSLPTQPTVVSSQLPLQPPPHHTGPTLPTVPVTAGLTSNGMGPMPGLGGAGGAPPQTGLMSQPGLQQPQLSQGVQSSAMASNLSQSMVRTNPTPFPANLTSLEPLPPSAVQQQQHQQPQLQQQPQQQPASYHALQSTQRLTPGTTTRLVQLPTQPIPQPQTRFTGTQVLTQRASGPPVSVLANVGAHGGQAQQQPQAQARIIRTVRPLLSNLQPQPQNLLPQQPQQQPQQRQPPAPQAIVQPRVPAPLPTQTPQPAPAQAQRRSLTLTKEQMMEAQEMFRTANKVTRPEKALILGFMAGSRDNPCPHLGNVVTIKLSENQENVQQGNQFVGMIVETHFQMNYSTGEWKRIKKLRRLEDLQQ